MTNKIRGCFYAVFNKFCDNPSSVIRVNPLLRAFTSMELLIVITIVAIVTVATLFALNPIGQINKTWDSQRKTNLSLFNKTLEEWYNDKNLYPTASEICYDAWSFNNTCHICGKTTTPIDFIPYLTQLPCDPNKTDGYLYQVDDINNPHWYRIYTNLSNTQDPEIINVGCDKGCGPDGKYNYGVTSPNIDLEKNPD